MPAFIYATCPCGRTLRAREDQAGTPVRCWSCARDVVVPHPKVRGRLARAMTDAVGEALRWPAMAAVTGWALLLTAALLVPYAGPWLGLAVGIAAAWAYGGVIRVTGLHGDRRGAAVTPSAVANGNGKAKEAEADPEPAATPEDAPRPDPGWVAWAGRLALGAAWVTGLVAPLLVRHGGYAFPEVHRTAGARAVMAFAFLGWVVMPVVMFAAFACDRRGAVPPREALGSLRRHGAAAAAAVLIVPLGLIVTEALIGFVAWEQGYLPLMVADLFPTPEFTSTGGLDDRAVLVFKYDELSMRRLFSDNTDNPLPVYARGLTRGFTLVGAVPASLPRGLGARMDPERFFLTGEKYLALRILLSALILTGLGGLLSIQARWLGLIASVGSHRPGGATGLSSASGLTPVAASASGSGLVAVAGSGSGFVPPAPAPAPAWTPRSGVPAATPPAWTPPMGVPAAPAAVAAAPAPPSASGLAPAPASPGAGGVPSVSTAPSLSGSSSGLWRTPTPPEPSGVSRPPAQSNGVAPNGDHAAPVPAPVTGSRPKVLIIEDEQALAETLAHILVSRGFNPILAGSGEEGVRQAVAAQPDLVVLDLMLPDTPGLQVCKTIRDDPRTSSIPILMATCLHGEAEELNGLNSGADDYVTKPYSVDVLIARMQKLLKRRAV